MPRRLKAPERGSSPPGPARRCAAAVFVALALVPPNAPAAAPPATSPQLRQETGTFPQPPATLESLLAKAAAYCRKLEGSAFDFVCREEIHETIDPKLEVAIPTAPIDSGSEEFLGPSLVISKVNKIKRSFVYDYQCVRTGHAIRETRTLLEENGKRKNVPNAELETSTVVWSTVLLGPVGMFGESAQPGYDFSLAGEELIGDTSAVVVEAKPKPGAAATRRLYGKAWIDPATGDILKIEWSEGRVGSFDVFARRGERFQRTPRLTLRSEFSVVKNGLRFPSHLTVEEAYLSDAGKVFVRSTTDVVYKDFRFATVEVEH